MSLCDGDIPSGRIKTGEPQVRGVQPAGATNPDSPAVSDGLKLSRRFVEKS
jgi:hypothetical protein